MSSQIWDLVLPYCDYASKLGLRQSCASLRGAVDHSLAAGRLWVTDSDGELLVRAEEGVLPFFASVRSGKRKRRDSSSPDSGESVDARRGTLFTSTREILVPPLHDPDGLHALLRHFPQTTRVVANHYHDTSSSSGAYDLVGREGIGVTLNPYCDCDLRLIHSATDVVVSVLHDAGPEPEGPECGVAAGIIGPSVRKLSVEVEDEPADLVFASMSMFQPGLEVDEGLEVEIEFKGASVPRQAAGRSREMWAGYLGIAPSRITVSGV